ncbi:MULTISPECIES: hypothetical protein [Pseudomonas]|uniref:hypothetical protein n=1 Tax=Pseudomonas TaxID=286 RepID=UPI001C0016B6|nr:MULTISPECIES: hypothetical protein [Pseudomonas]MBT9300119.1 hypothetical protein [Pseudomonas sp. TAE6080]|tara:strand:- start:11 stop:181 length:171 start_codon:yes stop_codon:yes gene_type:complete
MTFTLRIGIPPNHLKIKVILAKHWRRGGQQNAFSIHLSKTLARCNKKGQLDNELTF